MAAQLAGHYLGNVDSPPIHFCMQNICRFSPEMSVTVV
jgi:hypothetical protein